MYQYFMYPRDLACGLPIIDLGTTDRCGSTAMFVRCWDLNITGQYRLRRVKIRSANL